MYWIIGICAVVVFNVLVFMFMYGAEKQNKAYDKAMEEKKVCKIINDKFSWIMEVDGMKIAFNGGTNAEYFANKYNEMGYFIEWDRDKWKKRRLIKENPRFRGADSGGLTQ